ncbi:MAG: acyl-CoA dehydrogenase [Planctomycetes bacterium]|nr:acyl-CoA dehydrogenase [Planctomycetota bacterium]
MDFVFESAGYLSGLGFWIGAALVLATASLFLFHGLGLWIWAVALIALLHAFAAPLWLAALLGAPLLLLLIVPLRRALVSGPVLRLMRALEFLPAISETERTAIEAGDVWIEGELFSGAPSWKRLLREEYAQLSAEEAAFLDGPVEELCRSVKDWEVWEQRGLSAETWSFLKHHGFFGLIVPKEFGGKGFSPAANSAVVAKLSTRSIPLAITVMVPNSLGPAELLAHYGTDAQKSYWLPRLARGEEIPCFGLTEPHAGSDAGAIRAEGIVFKDASGELKLKLSWSKRYITLAPVATVIGLAFQLRDPENLLGKGAELGITCALVPASTPGVEHGRRHDPLGVPFPNGPTSGANVVLPLDCVIGGVAGAGQGWRMLMECLSAGRGISLPAQSTAGAALASRVAGAYARVRRQFGLAIAHFEGIQEPLARAGGFAWLLEAQRRTTCGGLNRGKKPAVASAIAKLMSTELLRKALDDAMDIVGGAGICRGPKNLLAHGYAAVPIGITVEGANILTRTLMIFGQGAIRCHPHAFAEMEAVAKGDVAAFDRAFFAHVGHVMRNGVRAVLLGVTRGRLAYTGISGPARPYAQRLAWCSARFAFLADFAMATLGGNLKRREALTGRFADVFSWMYLVAAGIKRFEAEGRRKEDAVFLRWSMEHAFAEMQVAFLGILRNFDLPFAGWLFRGPLALLQRMNPVGAPPRDGLVRAVAEAVATPGEARDARTGPYFHPSEANEPLHALERAFRLCHEAEAVERKLKRAVKEGRLPREKSAALLERAQQAGILQPHEVAAYREAETARDEVIQVDAFAAS